MSSKSKKAKTSAKGGVKKGESRTLPEDSASDTGHQSMVQESGEVRSTERDGEDRSSDVESAAIAPETDNSESGTAAILVMMERNRQEKDSVKIARVKMKEGSWNWKCKRLRWTFYENN